ncbi:MAG: hypothetical protein NZ602_06320 [Thermoguttaceae bacterium]|nr:hypothetical protein [Thermoguttaceae bacterium]
MPENFSFFREFPTGESPPYELVVIPKLALKRSNFTLGKFQKLVEQHRMDKIGNLAKTLFETKHFLLLEVIFPKCCNFSKGTMSFLRKVRYSPVWGASLLPLEWGNTSQKCV